MEIPEEFLDIPVENSPSKYFLNNKPTEYQPSY